MTLIAWSLSVWEIGLVLLVLLLLFGSTRLPGLARSLGSSLTEFKKGLRGEGGEDEKRLDPPRGTANPQAGLKEHERAE